MGKSGPASLVKLETVPKAAVGAVVTHNGSAMHTIIFLQDRFVQDSSTSQDGISLRSKREIAFAVSLSRKCLYDLCLTIGEHLAGVELTEANDSSPEGAPSSTKN